MNIITERFLLRPLRVADVSPKYLGWLQDKEGSRDINTATSIQGMKDLLAYVQAKASDDKTLFLGIFIHGTQEHIGNIKFEPLDFEKKRTALGVFIGEKDWRGKGVFTEVFQAIVPRLQEIGISQIYLGVKDYNVGAVKAYQKSGFVVTNSGWITGPNGIELCYTTGTNISRGVT